MKPMRLAEMTLKDVKQYLKKSQTIIFPWGVVEQHGHHLPLNTDIQNATVFGELLSARLKCPVAPTLNYAFSGGMLTGTINVRPTTFCQMVGDIVKSLSVQGFREIIVMPGHGGAENMDMLWESLRAQKWLDPSLADTAVFLVCPWKFSPTWMEVAAAGDYHAAHIETSLVLHWRPDLARVKEIATDAKKMVDRMRINPDAYQRRERHTQSELEVPTTTQDPRVRVGVMGSPEKASAELGKKVEAEAVTNMTRELKKVLAEARKSRRSGKRHLIEEIETMKVF